MNSRNNVRRSVGSKGRATAAAGPCARPPTRQVHRVHDGSARGRSRPHGWRRPGSPSPTVQQDAGNRDAREGNAAGGVQPGRADGSRRASRAGGFTRLAGTVRRAVEKLRARENSKWEQQPVWPGTRLIRGSESETKPTTGRASREREETQRGRCAHEERKNKRGCKPQDSPPKSMETERMTKHGHRTSSNTRAGCTGAWAQC